MKFFIKKRKKQNRAEIKYKKMTLCSYIIKKSNYIEEQITPTESIISIHICITQLTNGLQICNSRHEYLVGILLLGTKTKK